MKLLTKYVVGAKANPPKKPRSPPKKGKQIPTNIVNAANERKKINRLVTCMPQKIVNLSLVYML